MILVTFAFTAYRSFIKKITSEKNQQHRKELAHQKEISEQYATIQESERKRIAEILHDDVGNKLNVLSLWLNNESTWNDARAKEIVAAQIPKLIDATRNISHALYPVNLDQFGLILTIEELLYNINGPITLQLLIHHEYRKKSNALEVQLYRIIQEFLSNVIKHSKALEMTIQIRDSGKALSILLSDNGIGFDKSTAKHGMGLKNTESRLQSIHAFYKWKSQENKGCKLIIIIPK